MRGRAWRRAQVERMKRRVRGFGWLTPEMRIDPRWIGRAAATPKPCSCYGCGNPRNHFAEPTVQERRSLAA